MKRLFAIAALTVGLTIFGITSQASANDQFYGGHGGHHGGAYGGYGYGHGGYGHGGHGPGGSQTYAPSYGSYYGNVPNYGYPTSGYGQSHHSGYGSGYAPNYGHGYNHGGGVDLDIGRFHILGNHHGY